MNFLLIFVLPLTFMAAALYVVLVVADFLMGIGDE